MKVGVLMSGGVDSSVAARMMQEQGFETIGISMINWLADAAGKAARICSDIGIEHHVIDLRVEFEKLVIDGFCRTYAAGRTPNPCIDCNQYIKFGILMDKALELGCDKVASGHYARIEHDEASSTYRLMKGVDAGKDQSYFLYRLGQEQLSRIIFPLGALTKEQVRGLAREFGLQSAAEAEESQEICFINGHYGEFVAERISMPSGDFTDCGGKVLGTHRGLGWYTVGQRKGLGLAAGRPVYVTGLDPHNNRIVVGESGDLMSCGLEASDVVMIDSHVPRSFAARGKIRYAAPPEDMSIELEDGCRLLARFDKTLRAVTPGQALVLYDGDYVIGGGVINRAFRC